jgi:hypothetical protein
MIDIDYQQVILWILIVLAAGFIGQFGKSFATHLITVARKKKNLSETEKPEISVQQSEEKKSPVSVSETNGIQAKSEKKALKAQIKLRKKNL